MEYDFQNPIIVQSDKTVLLDVHSPKFSEARDALIPFAELEKSPEHLHTYRITPLSLWNAASGGETCDKITGTLNRLARFPVPQGVLAWISETFLKYGAVKLFLSKEKDSLLLVMEEEKLYRQLLEAKVFKGILNESTVGDLDYIGKEYYNGARDLYIFRSEIINRGTIKQKLLKFGWPCSDEIPLEKGEPLEISLKSVSSTGLPVFLRDYQKAAADALLGDGRPGSGFGTIILPCGAGKTIVGMEIMSRLKTRTLVVTTNISAVHQWIRELKDKTSLADEDIGEYTGECKEVKPVTVATYQILTWRNEKNKGTREEYPHFSLFTDYKWGLLVFDEVHTLPAPVFRVTAELQTLYRVGLTATLVREDGLEEDVFSLVGPKRYDVPWKEMEQKGWIAGARCGEIRLNLSFPEEILYSGASLRKKHRIASENILKDEVVSYLVKNNPDEKILIIGQYLEQLDRLSKRLGAPVITGKTPTGERENLYEGFRQGRIPVLILSKVGNFAIDLPDASFAIQVSGTFGSRQEEAQRLGRILRPKEKAYFYSIVTRGTVEEDFSNNRQKFLAEQGYTYTIQTWNGSELEDIGW